MALTARWALVPIAAISIVLAVGQSVVHRDPATYPEWKEFPGYFTREGPPTVSGLSQGADPMQVPPDVDHVVFPAPKAGTDRLSVRVRGGPDTYVATNIAGVWALLDLRGATFYGVDGGGRAIVQLTGTDGKISVGAAHPPAVIVGRLISLLGLALIAANFVLIAVGALRRRRGGGDRRHLEPQPERERDRQGPDGADALDQRERVASWRRARHDAPGTGGRLSGPR